MNFQNGADTQNQYFSTRKMRLDAKTPERNHQDLWIGISYIACLEWWSSRINHITKQTSPHSNNISWRKGWTSYQILLREFSMDLTRTICRKNERKSRCNFLQTQNNLFLLKRGSVAYITRRTSNWKICVTSNSIWIYAFNIQRWIWRKWSVPAGLCLGYGGSKQEIQIRQNVKNDQEMHEYNLQYYVLFIFSRWPEQQWYAEAHQSFGYRVFRDPQQMGQSNAPGNGSNQSTLAIIDIEDLRGDNQIQGL